MRSSAILALACALAAACSSAAGPASSTESTAPKQRTIDATGVRDAFTRRHTLTYKVNYSINGTLEKQAIAGRVIAYQIPPLRRVDMSIGNGRDSDAFTLYLSEDTIVACSLPFRPPCQEISPDEAASAALGLVTLDLAIEENPQALDRATVSEDRIAGQPVSCFLVQQPGTSKFQQGVELNACYTAEGILMRYGVTTPTLNVEVNALFLNRDVATEDLKLPPNAFIR